MASKRQRRLWKERKRKEREGNSLSSKGSRDNQLAKLSKPELDQIADLVAARIQPEVVTQVEEVKQELFVGPTPPPEVLEKYSQTYPEAPKMIFEMAAKEQQFRHGYETGW